VILLIIPVIGSEKSQVQENNTDKLPFLEKPSVPHIITFGVYPTMLYNFDLSRRTYKIGFYAWWRTQNKDYKPHKSVEITNAVEYYSKFGNMGKNQDEYFSYVHYYATILHNWDIKHFPFDRQFLEVQLEDFADISYVVFQPDSQESRIHHELILPDWNIIEMHLKHSVTTYSSNFGDVSTPKGEYSRLTFVIEMKRKGWRAFFSYYIGFFVAFFLCNIIYLVNPYDLGARASLSLAAIVTSVGNKYILDQILPITSDITLADVIQITTFVMITIAILTFIMMDRLAKEKGWAIHQLKKINGIIGAVSLVFYISVVGIYTYKAVLS
jgi:hypothetical protein